jgi:hypothetical protein
LLQTRPLLEGIVRRRLFSLPNIDARQNFQVDAVPAMAFFRVANLLAPPRGVMRPMVVLCVLRENLTGQTGGRREQQRIGPPQVGK